MLVYDIFGLGFMASQNNMEQGMPDYSSNRNDESFLSTKFARKWNTPSVQVWYVPNCVTQKPRRTLIPLCDASTNEPANQAIRDTIDCNWDTHIIHGHLLFYYM
jgi:hypothetical protein